MPICFYKNTFKLEKIKFYDRAGRLHREEEEWDKSLKVDVLEKGRRNDCRKSVVLF
jgi:hypothetical protein